MPLGDLVISQSGIGDDWTDYRRELDLDTGIASTHFRAGGSDGRFSREVFISAPDQVAVIRYTSTNAGTVQLEIGLRSPRGMIPAVQKTDPWCCMDTLPPILLRITEVITPGGAL